jgi:hypothetical protein
MQEIRAGETVRFEYRMPVPVLVDLASILGTTGATLLGGGLGAVLRLAPEILKLVDRGNERKHELALLDKNTAAEAARAAKAGLQEHQLAADTAQITAGIAALQEAVKGQAQQTGIAFVDAINATVRPILTYGIVGPYVFGKLMIFTGLSTPASKTSVQITPAEVKAAIDATYTVADMAIVSQAS